MITADEVNEILRYDDSTGFLYWKMQTGRVNAGDRAGCFDKSIGYIRIRIKGYIYFAHRVVWLMNNGEFPCEEIDHINRIRHDNRLVNLRAVSSQENSRNVKLAKNNTSGVCGVVWLKNDKKWVSRITVNGKTIQLGRFADWFDAVCARKTAEYNHGFHLNHGRRL